jgi:hypothetical protein
METDEFRHLSKSERRKLKKQRRRERLEREEGERKRKNTMNKVKIIIPIVLVVAVGWFLLSSLAVVPDAPILQLSSSYHNFGNVPGGGSVVSTLMGITNTGESDLIITGMDSSCGCTTASIVTDGVEGPRFSMSMHGTNPTGWSETIEPGNTAQLKIYYNPSTHSELRGPVTRYVTIFSNDPYKSQMRVTIEANQV